MPKPSLAAQVLPHTRPAPLAVQSTKVDALLDERAEVAAKLDQLTEKKKALDLGILDQCDRHTKRKDGIIETDDYTVTAVNANNTYVDRKALLDLGVKLSIIEQATKVTPYRYPRVTRKTPQLSPEQAMKDAMKKIRKAHRKSGKREDD